jgi:hypothetical protein
MDEKKPEISPYCVRCVLSIHGGMPHEFHETNEHDEWLQRRSKDGNISG